MRIGEILVERGLVTTEQIEEARAEQGDRRLGAALVEMGHVALDEVSRALAQQKGIPSLRLEFFKNADPEAVRALDPTLAARYFAAAVGFKTDEDGNRRLVVAMRDPDDDAVQTISDVTGYHVVPAVVTEFLLNRVIERFYGVQPRLELEVVKPEAGSGQAMVAPGLGAAALSQPGGGQDMDDEQAGPAAEIVYGICAEHPERKTVFVCPDQECRGEWCLDCSDHRWMPQGFVDHCGRCGEALVDMRQRRGAPRGGSRAGAAAGAAAGAGGTAATGSLFERLPDLARYPFTSSGLTLLIGLTVIATILGAIQIFFSIMLVGYAARVIRAFIWAFIWGFELTVFFGILTATADGKDKIDIDDVIRLDESVFDPIKRFGAAHLPLILAVFWWAYSLVDESVFDALLEGDVRTVELLGQLGLPTIAVLLAVGLLPLLIMVAAVASSAWSVLNPSRWWEILRTVGKSYGAAAVLFYVVALLEWIVLQFLINELGAVIDSQVLVLPFAKFPAYILFAIRMRILGGLLQPFRDQLIDPS